MCIQSGANPHEQRVGSASTMVHRNFDATYLHFDIAILRLRQPLEFNDYVQPVCIPTTPAEGGTDCVAIGWGTTRSTSIIEQVYIETVKRNPNAAAHHRLRGSSVLTMR